MIDFGDGKGVEEVQAIRDVVAASRAAGLERWVKAGLGLGKADEPEEKGS